jgi:hypothetical protein
MISLRLWEPIYCLPLRFWLTWIEDPVLHGGDVVFGCGTWWLDFVNGKLYIYGPNLMRPSIIWESWHWTEARQI